MFYLYGSEQQAPGRIAIFPGRSDYTYIYMLALQHCCTDRDNEYVSLV